MSVIEGRRIVIGDPGNDLLRLAEVRDSLPDRHLATVGKSDIAGREPEQLEKIPPVVLPRFFFLAEPFNGKLRAGINSAAFLSG
jgi:hypothetical protein